KLYDFFTDIENLEHGNKLVVDAAGALHVVTFFEYNESPKSNASKWVIQKVDLDAHIKRLEAQRKLEQIRVKMEEESRKAQELEIFEILAKQNTEMAKLIQEYKQLSEVL